MHAATRSHAPRDAKLRSFSDYVLAQVIANFNTAAAGAVLYFNYLLFQVWWRWWRCMPMRITSTITPVV